MFYSFSRLFGGELIERCKFLLDSYAYDKILSALFEASTMYDSDVMFNHVGSTNNSKEALTNILRRVVNLGRSNNIWDADESKSSNGELMDEDLLCDLFGEGVSDQEFLDLIPNEKSTDRESGIYVACVVKVSVKREFKYIDNTPLGGGVIKKERYHLVWIFSDSSFFCSCLYPIRMGLPCRHFFQAYLNRSLPIIFNVLRHCLLRWLKLDTLQDTDDVAVFDCTRNDKNHVIYECIAHLSTYEYNVASTYSKVYPRVKILEEEDIEINNKVNEENTGAHNYGFMMGKFRVLADSAKNNKVFVDVVDAAVSKALN